MPDPNPRARTNPNERNMPIVIRPETAADNAVIEQLTTAAFQNAPHTNHTEQFIVNALRRAGQLSVSLVAQDGDEMVGHVAISPVSLTCGTTGWYGVGPISVSPERQGQGIGTQLMQSALAQLRRRESAGCVVLGDPAYYGRFGFFVQPGLVLSGVPAEYFQAILFSGNWPVGSVSYHAAFDATQ